MQPQDPQQPTNFDPFAQPQQPVPAQPAPMQPAAQPYDMPAQQPADYPTPAAHHAPEHHAPAAHHGNVPAVEHVSNPYVATTNGLVTILKTNPVAAMLSAFVGILACTPLLILAIVTTPQGSTEPGLLSALFTILFYLALIPSVVGPSIAVASASGREEKITTGQALSAVMRKALPLLGFVIVGGLMYFIGILLLLIPGLIVLARISLAPMVMFDENLGPIASIKRSFALTKGHFFEMWGVLIANMVMTGGGLLSPAVGAAPLLSRYQQYKSIEAGKTTANKVHWLNYFNTFIPIVFVLLVIAIVAAGVGSMNNRLKDSTPANPYGPSLQYDSTPTTDYNYDF